MTTRYLYILLLLLPAACKRFIEIDPPVTQPSSEVVYKNDATAVGVMTGIYVSLAGNSIAGGPRSFSAIGGAAADEFELHPPTNAALVAAYSNALSSTGDIPFWSISYYYIYTVNSVLDNLDISPDISEPVKKQLRGEARFMRAFFYFYLVNFFGDVPMALTADYKANATLARSDKSLVWQQIIADLKAAQELLSDEYRNGSLTGPAAERVRPNKWTATALLARAYLYNKQWQDAEIQASAVIAHTALYSLPSLDDAFLTSSTEAIWQLQTVQAGYASMDGFMYILTGNPTYSSPISLSTHILDAFEPGDARRSKWISSIHLSTGTLYFPFKYKIKNTNSAPGEYQMIMRLGEQFLIRAEARAQLDDMEGAVHDLNELRSRARLAASTGIPDPLPALPSTLSKDETLEAIAHERQVELFSEWAHRWLDLKRTGRADAVMTTVTAEKGGTWSSSWQLFPIPYTTAILPNPNITQNKDY